MNLDELCDAIRERAAGRDVRFSWLNRGDGSQEGSASINGVGLLCTWKATLINPPVLDGVTPRGPKDYHSLKFFDGEAKS